MRQSVSYKYITSTCNISHGSVYKNGKLLFENKTADVSAFLLSIYQHFKLNYPKFYKMDNLSKLGWLASEILLDKQSHYEPEYTGVVFANTNSSLDDDLKYYDSVKDVPSPSLFVYTLPNIVIGEICIRNNFKGEHAFYILDRFDAGFMEKQVSYLLDNDILQTCICGWVDVLEKDYKAVLFLVEKKVKEEAEPFSEEYMDKLFNLSE